MRRSEAFKTDEGSDSTFLIAAVKCAAKSFPVDAKRVYLGGISSGGTMTSRALTFRSDFWAGGLPMPANGMSQQGRRQRPRLQ